VTIKLASGIFDTQGVKRRLILLLPLAAIVAVVKLLPWWGSLAALVGLGLCLKLFAWKLIEKLMLGAFKAKGAALAGADATLHAITRAEPPKPDPEAVGEDAAEMEQHAPPRWVHIDMTVHVPEGNSSKTPFRLWDPGELSLVPVDAKPGPPPDGEESVGSIAGVELYQDGQWVTLDEKLQGSQRIRLHAGVSAGVEFFKFRYYFEIVENRDTIRR
jgi:hypothetical protein